MSIPLDRLYNYLDSIINDDIIIYRFFPHGSRKLEELLPLNVYKQLSLGLNSCIICHDQEPLNYSMYSEKKLIIEYATAMAELTLYRNWFADRGVDWLNENIEILAGLNLKIATDQKTQFHKVSLLLHSEKRSDNLLHYENNRFVGVYWWSHALISADWFRYAKIDPGLNTKLKISDLFLIYNRAWAGTREYRLTFAELLVKNNLHQSCRMKFNPMDDSVHYKNHIFKNTKLSIGDITLENYFEKNTVDSTASADYVSEDYQNTLIEVVLETLFDDERLHLTEKSLRPIACGQPFMLMATHGSLEYLRSYGFKTFAPYINEDYDTIVDPLERMSAIIVEMKRIASLSVTEKRKLSNDLKKISAKNKKLFFSTKFNKTISEECRQNFQIALAESQRIMNKTYKSILKAPNATK